ncbi:MAG TPA: acyltransferase [Candidatus Dormibacteraeota bacterium]|nr:acyltransferase [Candidatus Dormibacteraeota bacterium]
MEVSTRIRAVYEISNGQRRLVPIEGLRGFAVLLVFFVHFDAFFGRYASLHPLIKRLSVILGNIGNTGVDLFFVLSGALIYGALIRRKVSYFKFIGRRLERIYPAFLAVFCIYLILSAVFPGESKIHGSLSSASLYVLENALLLPGILPIIPIITVAWSLSYEFFFYLIIPIVVGVTRMRAWKGASRVAFFVGLWLFYLLYAFTVPRSQVRLLMFIAGILLYEAMDSTWLKRRLTRWGEIFSIVIFLASLAFVYLYDAHANWFGFLPGLTEGRTVLPGIPTFQGPYKVIVLSISCTMLVFYSVEFDGLLRRFFSWNPLRYLGNMSYSYYLIHGLALHALAMILYSIVPEGQPKLSVFLLALPVGFAMTWVAASILFILVEKPMSLRRHLAGVAEREQVGDTLKPLRAGRRD